MSQFSPFGKHASVTRIGPYMRAGSTEHSVRITGSAAFTRDKTGLTLAQALKAAADAIAAVRGLPVGRPAPVIVPFANDVDSASIGAGESILTIENGTDQVTVYGDLTFGSDDNGRKLATELSALVDALVSTLVATPGLPDKVARTGFIDTVGNPFV